MHHAREFTIVLDWLQFYLPQNLFFSFTKILSMDEYVIYSHWDIIICGSFNLDFSFIPGNDKLKQCQELLERVWPLIIEELKRKYKINDWKR